jgi:hypothetical protein
MSIKKKIIKYLILRLFQSAFYSYVILNIIPYIRFNFYYTNFKGWKYKRGYKKLKSGFIILTNDKWKFTSFLIPEEFSHAALCVKKSIYSEFEIAEMTHTNYTKSTFYDICKEATHVRIIECLDWDRKYTKKVIEKCKSFENIKYDVGFKLGVKALYCSELVVESDFEKRLIVDYSDIAGLGMPYISPHGLSRAKNIRVVWDSLEEEKRFEQRHC